MVGEECREYEDKDGIGEGRGGGEENIPADPTP